MKQPCEVCNKGEAVHVVSSGLQPYSFSICKSCLQLGAEPYAAIIASLFGMTDFGGLCDWAKPIIDISLQVANKTEQELWADVRKLEQDFEQACQNSPS